MKKIKFNFIDVVIIAAVALVLVIFGYYALGNWETSEGVSENIMDYTVEIKDVPEYYVGKIKVGDSVYDVRKGAAIGKVAAVSDAAAFEITTENRDEGTYVKTPVPGRYTYYVTIRTPYKENAAGYTVNDVDIKVGKSITIKTEGLATDATILKLEKEASK